MARNKKNKEISIYIFLTILLVMAFIFAFLGEKNKTLKEVKCYDGLSNEIKGAICIEESRGVYEILSILFMFFFVLFSSVYILWRNNNT